MKIAVIAHSHYPVAQPFSGGLATHTHQMTTMLQQLGHEVVLFAPEGSDPNLPVEYICKPGISKGQKPNATLTNRREPAYKKLMQTLKNSNFDIIHNNSLHRAPLDAASSMPMSMVTVLHTPPGIPMVDGFRGAVASENHYTIAVSNRISNVWSKELKFIRPEVIYNGIDTVKFLPVPDKDVENYAIWSGRITTEKGTHLAIEAAVKAGIHLKICGPIHDQVYFNQSVLPLLQRYKQYVSYLGNLENKALVKVIAKAKVFVCTPCWEEAFGLVVAEALACGVPIAGFKRGALPEILTDQTGVLVAEDINQLSHAIIQAGRLCRRTCRNHAVDKFSIEKMIHGYNRVYQNALDYQQHKVRNTANDA